MWLRLSYLNVSAICGPWVRCMCLREIVSIFEYNTKLLMDAQPFSDKMALWVQTDDTFCCFSVMLVWPLVQLVGVLMIYVNMFAFLLPDDHLLPSWLQALVACCCHVDTFPVQCTSISTMLTLIVLTQSVQSDSPSFISHRTQSTGEGTISVVMLPALLPRHLQYLERNTRFHWVNEI